MRSPVRIGILLLAAIALAVPAGATEAATAVLTQQRTYVHCGADKASVNKASTFQWNTTAPTTSFTTGGGCGQLDTDKTEGDDTTFTGTFTGNLDTLTAKAWVIDAGPVRAAAASGYEEIYTNVSLVIDGVDYVAAELKLVPKPSSTGLARLLEFSVTGINLLDPVTQAGTHQVSLKLGSASYLDGDQVIWVLDATEVDSGIDFNPATLSNVVVPAEVF